MIEKLKCIIVAKDTALRVRLKSCIKLVVTRPEIIEASSFQEGADKISKNKFQLIFLHLTKDAEEICAFLEVILANTDGKLPPVAVTLGGQKLNSEVVADLFLTGVSGFLREPFAVDELDKLIKIVQENEDKPIDDAKKNSVTSGFLLGSAMQLIDATSREKATDLKAGGRVFKEAKRVASKFREVAANVDKEKLEDILFRRFAAAQTDKKTPSKRAQKSSVREATHPGLEVASLMEKRSLDAEKVQNGLGLSEEEFQSLLQGKLNLTEKMASSLAISIGQTSDYWVRKQKRYDDFIESKKG